jgi:hypothetical protein
MNMKRQARTFAVVAALAAALALAIAAIADGPIEQIGAPPIFLPTFIPLPTVTPVVIHLPIVGK